MKKKILVSGLSGMVGSRFRELYQEKYDFENLDLSEGVDITNKVQLDRIIGESDAETIIHLAAFTNVSAAHEQNGDKEGPCYRVNVVGTENIAASCKAYGKYLIHISTDYVFDGTKEEVYTEEDTPNPIEWYGQTKLWAEEKVQEILDDQVILRLAFPYQANPMRPDFLAKMIENMKANSLPPQFDNHYLTPTYVDDLAGVFDYATEHKPQGIYHCVGSSWHTDYEIALMVKEKFGLEADVKAGDVDEYIKKVNRPYQKSMKVSNEKLKRDMGVEMKRFDEGLRFLHKQLAIE
jgi:dTDP-4-dehydrorhamnose reductase